MLKAICLKVPKNLGEKALHLIRNLKLFNRKLKIKNINNFLYIPLNQKPSQIFLEEFKKNLSDYEILTDNFSKIKKRHFTPLDFLVDRIPDDLYSKIPKSIDLIGEIGIIEIPPELEKFKEMIGKAFLKSYRQIKTILVKRGVVKGIYRLREFEIIAGVKQTTTFYKEYNCIYRVDVAKTYFSPRLSREHNRVASLIKGEETVIDLFSGVGPFVIPIAKNQKKVVVYAIDINPNAISFLKRNIILNRVEKQITPILGEAGYVIKNQLYGLADRVIMNLPETSIEFVDVACQALKNKGGIIHFYRFSKDSDPIENSVLEFSEMVNRNDRKVKEILFAKTIREVAPYTWQVVIDAKIQ